jgi:predicted RNA methylase
LKPPEHQLEREALRAVCEGLGYDGDLRQEDYPVWRGDLRGDIVCFTDPDRYDMATAAIVAGISSGDRGRERHFAVSNALAAPICVLQHEAAWEVWGIGAQRGEPARLSLTHDRPDEDPSVVRFLAPEALAAAKRDEIQLPLFDLDLGVLGSQREAAAAALDRRVKSTVAQLLRDPATAPSRQAETAARLVVQALSALAIRDKIVPDRNLASALAIVEERMADRAVVSPDEVTDVAEHLGAGLNFRALDPSLLGEVYERAILVPARRLQLGAYYTPPEVGRRILEHLPVESIEPEKRRFADPSCGSGTLLLAASDRLASALPVSTAKRDSHAYARDRLIGSDRDPFAVEITRLALFLQALPYGNGFHVERRDALAPIDASWPRPTFVVTNPPWKWERASGRRRQLADAFLRAIVHRVEPGGFIGCVLPASWLTSDTDRDSRAWLREAADVFEVWRLPMHTFRLAKMAPCVVFARVNVAPGTTYVFRNVWRSGRKNFLSGGSFDQSVISEYQGGTTELTPGNRLGEQLPGTVPLRSLAAVRDGAPTNDIAAVGAHGGDHLFLPEYGVVPPFGRVTHDVIRPCRYPEDFSKRGAGSRPDDYLHRKVLVSAMSTVDIPWRLRAFLDDVGVIPRNSMYSIVPRENTEAARLALLGILSSAFASLWIADRTATRMINASTLVELPVPPPDRWGPITRATERVVEAQGSPAKFTRAIEALEEAVLVAYDAPDDVRETVAATFAGTMAPEGVVRYPRIAEDDDAGPSPVDSAPGSVVAVADDRVQIHVPGVTSEEGTWIRLPGALPGWLARPDATFLVRGASAGLSNARYHYQEYSWMTLEDLLTEAAHG